MVSSLLKDWYHLSCPCFQNRSERKNLNPSSFYKTAKSKPYDPVGLKETVKLTINLLQERKTIIAGAERKNGILCTSYVTIQLDIETQSFNIHISSKELTVVSQVFPFWHKTEKHKRVHILFSTQSDKTYKITRFYALKCVVSTISKTFFFFEKKNSLQASLSSNSLFLKKSFWNRKNRTF